MAAAVPIPPAELSARIGRSPHALTDRERYLERGRGTKRAIERVLPDDWSWEGKAVLDFGCGPARAIRHFTDLAPETELWGCDISVPAIEWSRQHLEPPISFVVNGEAPPLPFPDGKFDLIYALSVFTHITEHWAAWLLEMDRILAPGGRLLATYMGEAMCELVTGEPWDEHNFGMNVYEAGQDWALGGPMVVHSPWWIEEHWGRLFTIEALEPHFAEKAVEEGQDDQGVVLMRKDSKTETIEGLKRLDPAEPREATALHHDVHHLRYEVEALRARAGNGSTARVTGRQGAAAAWGAVKRRLRRV